MLDQEAAHQLSPIRFAEGGADHRETMAQQAGEVVEHQLAVDREAAILDARRARLRGRVAHVRGECVQLRLQRVHATAACSWRTRASSASNSGNGGKLKSRSSRVGRTPCAR